jgi:hypothetical protein
MEVGFLALGIGGALGVVGGERERVDDEAAILAQQRSRLADGGRVDLAGRAAEAMFETGEDVPALRERASQPTMGDFDAPGRRPPAFIVRLEGPSQLRFEGLNVLGDAADRQHPSSASTQVNCLPPTLTPILGMAPPAYPRISRQLAPAPIPGSGGRRMQANRTGRRTCPRSNAGNNARKWWVVLSRPVA